MFFGAWFMGADPLPRSVAISIRGALLAIVPVVAISVGLLGIDAIAGTWSAVVNPSTWRAAFSSTYAITAMLSIVASVLAMSSARRERTASRVLAAAAAFTAAAALTASGHASTAPPQWVSRPAMFVHASSLIFWVGALLPLAGAFALLQPRRMQTLIRFSRTIPWVVGSLVLTGAALAIVQLRSFEALTSSQYGRVLLLKLGLVALLFAVAAYNRFRLTPRMNGGDAGAELGFVRSIGLELALILAILGTVALWRFTPPPRALANSPSIISLHLHGSRLMAAVTILPGQVGANSVTVLLMGPDHRPLIAKELRLDAANEQAGIEPVRRQAIPDGAGSWKVTDLVLAAPGRWKLQLSVLVDDFTSVRLEEQFGVQP
jgi:copper transport protein